MIYSICVGYAQNHEINKFEHTNQEYINHLDKLVKYVYLRIRKQLSNKKISLNKKKKLLKFMVKPIISRKL